MTDNLSPEATSAGSGSKGEMDAQMNVVQIGSGVPEEVPHLPTYKALVMGQVERRWML